MIKSTDRAKPRVFKRAAIIGLLVIFAAAISTGPVAARWDWGAGFYLWALGMDGTLTVRGNPADVDIGFSEIWDNLDLAFSAHVEGRPESGRHGFFFDVYWADLGNELDMPLGAFDMQMAFVEGAGTFALGENFDVIYGLRYTKLDVTLEFDLPAPPITPPMPILPSSVSGDQSWTDLMVGGRWNKQFSKTWGFRARGDMAGFGISNSSDFTWNIQLLGTARFGKLTELLFGYRWYDVDYVDSDAGFAMDARLEGPVLALGFHW
jgi:hypothetical protein